MSSVVVTTQGALVRHVRGQVLVELERQVIQRFPETQVERVLILGRAHLSIGFLELAFRARIPVTYLSQDGSFKGRLDPGDRRDVALRLAQYRGLENHPWRLEQSRPLVAAKLAGQRGVLLRAARNHPHPALAEAAGALASLTEELPSARTLPALMGREGAGARAYFAAFPQLLRRPLPFRGRSRRPPRDEVNALLSLGYGLLTVECVGVLAGVGLDPQIGLFHSPRGRVPALAQDLLEPFRAPVVDALALSLANLGILRVEHFEAATDGDPEEGGFCLTKEALTVYFRQYRRRMQAPFRARDGRTTSFRKELHRQAGHLRRVVLGQEPLWEPFRAPGGGPWEGANPGQGTLQCPPRLSD